MTQAPPSPALDALMAALPLAELPRSGWLQIGLPPGIPPETIASHSHMVALLVLRLGPAVELETFDVHRAAAMATTHDVAESFLGDLPRAASQALPTGAKSTAEARIMEDHFPEMADLYDEYKGQKSFESRFVALCDKLQMGLFALRLARSGHGAMDGFIRSITSLDCTEFPPLAHLHSQIVQELSPS